MAESRAMSASCQQQDRAASGDRVIACACPASARRLVGHGAVVNHTALSLLGLAWSGLIALFPKCPVCWAAYMNMFGCVWLANATSMRWLFPVLLAGSGLHLVRMLQRSRRNGYGPFVLSSAGMATLVISRNMFAQERWLTLTGMLLVLLGSLLGLIAWNVSTRPSRV